MEEAPAENAALLVKEEPLEVSAARRAAQGQLPGAYPVNEDDSEQQIECTTESQENEIRLSLSKCIFCNKSFVLEDEPKLLECLHAVCAPCITSKLSEHDSSVDADVMMDGSVITCSVCNITSQIENMIENRFFTKYLEEENATPDEDPKDVEEEKKCTSCHDNATATSWCVDCEEFICQNCVMAHQRLKITKDHTIKPKEEVANEGENVKKGEKKLPMYLFCSVHPHEQLSLFCQTCDRLTCRDCQLSDHRDHKYKFIHEIAAETRTSVSTLLKDVSYKRVLLKSAMKVIEDRQILISEKKKSLVQDITQMVVQLTNAINVRGKHLVMRLNDVCDHKQNTLNEKKAALDQLSKLTDHCIQFVKYALEKGSDMELLYSKKSVTNHLLQIKNRRADIPNPDIPVRIHLSLDKVPDLIKVVSSIGGVVADGRMYPSISPHSESTSAPSTPFSEPPATETRSTPSTASASAEIPPANQQQVPPSAVGAPLTSFQTQPMTIHHLPQGQQQQQIAQQQVPPQQQSPSQQQQQPQPQLQQPPQQHPQQQQPQQVQHPQHTPPHQMHPQPPSYMQHYNPHNMHPRSSPQAQHQPPHQPPHQQRMPYNVTFNNRLQQQMMMAQQRGFQGNCHQQQVTSSTHPHPQVGHVAPEHLGQNASLRGLLAHNPPAYRPPPNQGVPYGFPGGYRFPANGQRPMPPLAYQPSNTPMLSGIRMQQLPTPATPQHINFQNQQQQMQQQQQQQQQATARWHIPQNANNALPPAYAAVRPSAQSAPVAVNDTYKITLKNQQGGTAVSKNSNPSPTVTAADGTAVTQNSTVVSHTVSSSMPKTPSPGSIGKPDETEKSLDKFCQKSLNDLMLTIAKLDSNGIVVIPEAQRNQMDSSQVDSSTDEGVNAMTDNSSDNSKTTAASGTKDDPNEDWCAVCMDGGDAVLCCDKCPKVFHLYCHVPPLKSFPHESETWQCMLCTNVADYSDDPPLNEKRPNSMTPRELRIAQRIVLELYCQFEQSMPFREVVSPEITEYHRIIKKPIALDVIKEKLKPESPDHYKDLRHVMADIRLMFKNAFTYNPVESQVYHEARNLEEFFEKLLLKWAPTYAYDDPFLVAEEEDEEVFPPNRKYRRIISD